MLVHQQQGPVIAEPSIIILVDIIQTLLSYCLCYMWQGLYVSMLQLWQGLYVSMLHVARFICIYVTAEAPSKLP